MAHLRRHQLREPLSKYRRPQNPHTIQSHPSARALQATMNVAALEDDLKLLQIDVGAEQSSSPTSPLHNVSSDHFVHSCLEQSYPQLLKYQHYQEVDDLALDILNTDWSRGDYIRIAAGNLLAGAVLVDDTQALLINCIELYNRKPSIDPHHERFGSPFMVSSLPTLSHRYQKISVVNKVEDKSKKLIIGTLVFNVLITSSIRLDTKFPAEVGASTFNFAPSKRTQLFLSSRSIEAANRAIAEKQQTYGMHDFMSTLRQVRTRFTNPKTYTIARFSTEWTHFAGSMPYTVFTIGDKPNVDSTNSNILCARALSLVANAVKFHDGILYKSDFTNLMLGLKDSAGKTTLANLIQLFEKEDKMNIIGNSAVESLLMDMAQICTRELRVANDSVKQAIVEHMESLE
ncbi:hypothetical protein MBANPS3_004554 [Mucor bainieri]